MLRLAFYACTAAVIVGISSVAIAAPEICNEKLAMNIPQRSMPNYSPVQQAAYRCCCKGEGNCVEFPQYSSCNCYCRGDPVRPVVEKCK